jgi:phage FluMu gp28-like protein
MEQQIILAIKNFEKQQSIFDHPARHKIAVKGRRFGLTKGAANDFMKAAIEKKFKRGLWVDTINQNIERYVERFFLPHLKNIPEQHWHWRKQEKILELFGSYIDFRSADRPENIEGFGYDKYFINEAGIILKDPYLWNNAIKPMLWDYKASGVVGGTPKGKGQFWELAERGKDKEQPNYAYFHFTTFDNPYIDVALVKEEIRDMPERVVQQEIYAQFLEDTGVVFRNVLSVATAKPLKAIPEHIYVMGVDLAKVEDYTVITVYDRKENNQVYQERFKTLEWPFQKKKIVEIARAYNNALCALDATGVGDPIADDLIRSGLAIKPIKFTNETKKEMIEKLVIWIEQKKLSIINLEETLGEFNSFTYDISRSGRVMYNAPVGFHDDIVMSHALAVKLLYPVVVEPKQKEQSIIHQELLRQMKGRYEENEIYQDEWDDSA